MNFNKKTAESGPRLTVKISDEEKQIAKQAKAEFKLVLKELKIAVELVTDLRDSIVDQNPSKDELNNVYRGRILRYRKKIVDKFNAFLIHLQSNISLMSNINDPDMYRLREILVAEVGELIDGTEVLLELLHDPIRNNFIQSLEQIVWQIEKRKYSIEDAIANQLFNHLDHDLLGRIRISTLSNRTTERSQYAINIIKLAKYINAHGLDE